MNGSKISLIQILVSLLTLATAVMHFLLYPDYTGFDLTSRDGTVPDIGLDYGIAFIINGVGYIVLLLALYYLPFLKGMRKLFVILLAAWTAGTIIAWYFYHPFELTDNSIYNKIVEGVLLLLLIIQFFTIETE